MSSDNETNVNNSETVSISSGVLGSVKWFNNRVGYGFITATGDHSNYGDVFVHHSELKILDSDIYKYLVQGEYVQFNIVKPKNGKYEYQAVNVTGVNGGKLMCENQHTIERLQRTSYRGTQRTFNQRNTERDEATQQTSVQSSDNTPRSHSAPSTTRPSYRTRRPEQNTQENNNNNNDGFQFPKGRKPRTQVENTPRRSPSETPYKNSLEKNITPKK